MESIQDEEFDKYIFYHSLNNIDTSKLSGNHKLCPRNGVRILTYNIFLRPPPVKNNDDDYKNERLQDFCKIINDFDIICLQEMFSTYNSRKHELISEAYKKGFFFFIDAPTPSLFSQYMTDAGLVILSR
jgi:hypothetical protein